EHAGQQPSAPAPHVGHPVARLRVTAEEGWHPTGDPRAAPTAGGPANTHPAGARTASRICAVLDREKNARSRGWCDKHYWRWQKYGSPTQVTLVYGDDDARFWAKVDKQENGCWLWTAGLFSTGYACFSINQTSLLAHRWAYARLVGPIPDDLTLDHLCREPRCV